MIVYSPMASGLLTGDDDARADREPARRRLAPAQRPRFQEPQLSGTSRWSSGCERVGRPARRPRARSPSRGRCATRPSTARSSASGARTRSSRSWPPPTSSSATTTWPSSRAPDGTRPDNGVVAAMPKLALIGVALVALGSSPHLVARIPTGDSPGGATAAFGAVWVANDRSGTLARIDPATNRVTRRLRLKPGLFSVTHGFGALWVVNYETGMLARVDPRSGRVRSVRVGGTPFDVAAAFGRVWVTAWEAGKLVEVDPAVASRPPHRDRAAADRLARRRRRASGSASAARRPRSPGSTRAAARSSASRSASARRPGSSPGRAASGSRRPTTCSSTSRERPRGRPAHVRTHPRAGRARPGRDAGIPDKEQNVVYRVDPGRPACSARSRPAREPSSRSAPTARCG